jgi:hypothetical protein
MPMTEHYDKDGNLTGTSRTPPGGCAGCLTLAGAVAVLAVVIAFASSYPWVLGILPVFLAAVTWSLLRHRRDQGKRADGKD